MSVILGLNALHAGASAALIVDGEVVAAIAEERLNRVKYYAGFPKLSIVRCLEMAGLQFGDIDVVALGRNRSANLGRKLAYTLVHPRRLAGLNKIRSRRTSLDDLRSVISKECAVDPGILRFVQHNVEHHIAHTASAFFASGWERSAGFSLDGSGDFVTCLLSECEGNKISPKHRVFVPHSLGSLYTMVCEFIGYAGYGDEGKVMGLAPLGKSTYVDQLSGAVRLTKKGIELNPEFFVPFGENQGISIDKSGQMTIDRHYSDYVREIFGEAREPYGEITERDKDLAFGLQKIFEDGYFHLLKMLQRLVPNTRVSMAGGCVLNSVANGKVFDQTSFEKTWIQPAAGDDGLALGAALFVSRSVLGESGSFVMTDAYLGPEFADEIVRRELDRRGVHYLQVEREELLRRTAKHLSDGEVVGWFQGRMEWGPRALGNRSILAHPGLPNMKDILNARIKRREWFRPFAPTVLQGRQNDIFEHSHPSPFMLHVYGIKPEWQDRLVAVNHVDNTGRLQTLERHENPLYYDLISSFERLTGIPILLNTSFNENEPIVCDPAEAIDCFLRTRMDTLAIGPFICRKSHGDPD